MDVQQDVHSLLKGKSRCLAHLVEMSRLFVESVNSAPDSVTELTAEFDRKRSDSFQTLELIDERIQEIAPGFTRSPAWVDAVRATLVEQQELSRTLQQIDSSITALIEEACRRLTKEMQDQTRLREKLSKFKSHWIPDQGEGLDQTL